MEGEKHGGPVAPRGTTAAFTRRLFAAYFSQSMEVSRSARDDCRIYPIVVRFSSSCAPRGNIILV
jgi:hypothetical protein